MKERIESWVKALSRADPVARWISPSVEELDINFEGDIETRVHRIGDYYLVVTDGGGADLEIDYFSNLAEVSERMKFESERGDPDDGWEFSVKKFNQLEDQYPLLPADVRETETPRDIVHLLTEYDEDFMDWLVAG